MNIEELLKGVSEASGFSVNDLKGTCRLAEIVLVRDIFLFICEVNGVHPSVSAKAINRSRVSAIFSRKKMGSYFRLGDKMVIDRYSSIMQEMLRRKMFNN